MAEQKETKNPVQSAERIFQVMEMLADHGEMGLMEISTALGDRKSTRLNSSHKHRSRMPSSA